MKWKMEKMETLCDQVRGVSYNQKDVISEPQENYFKILRANNIQNGDINLDNLVFVPKRCIKDQQFLIKNDILIAASSGSISIVGKAARVKQDINGAFGAFCKVLRPNCRVDPLYFSLYFQSLKYRHIISNLAAGANINNLKNEHFNNLEIPLPPLSEQKRIAGILDKADKIRKKRQQAIKECDEFLKATFLDMFGDPVTNPKGWKKKRLGDLLGNIDGGWSPKCDSKIAPKDSWGVLKLGAISSCNYLAKENKLLFADMTPKCKLEVKSGDVLFSRKNTYELVAACTYVFQTRPKLMISDLIFRLVIKETTQLNPIFLWKLLTEPRQRGSIQSLAGGAAGSMPNISKAKLKEVNIPVPPISLQEKFANIVEKTEAIKSRMQESAKELDDNFNNLMQRAFKGEL